MNFSELQELIKCGKKRITLTEDVILDDFEAENFKNGIEIKADEFVIDGNGHVIDGNRKALVFEIKNSKITLSNIIFKNGYCESSGGAVNNGGDLTIRSCKFINNSCDDFGGAIFTGSNSKISILQGYFEENRSDYGGAIYIDSDSLISIDKSVFKSNSSEFEGGAIFAKSKIMSCGNLFCSNASFKGGAIYNESFLKICDCSFHSNIASEYNEFKDDVSKNLFICRCDFLD